MDRWREKRDRSLEGDSRGVGGGWGWITERNAAAGCERK